MEACVRQKLPNAHLDSAGISASFGGQNADRRMREEGERRGIPISHLSRMVEGSDFFTFEYMIAATKGVKETLEEIAPHGATAKILLANNEEIPDPYLREVTFPGCFDTIERLTDWVIQHVGEK